MCYIRKSIIFFIVVILGVYGETCTKEQKIDYISFLGDSYSMDYIKSEYFCLLYDSYNYDKRVLKELLSELDTIYNYLIWLTEFEPRNSDFVLEDYTTIAIVKRSCSISCGNLGMKGIEIEDKMFHNIYTEYLLTSCISSVFIYEFGRNFWPICNNSDRNQNLDFKHIVHTSYAVFLRSIIIQKFKLNFCEINEIKAIDYMEHIIQFIYKYKVNKNNDLIKMLNSNREFVYGKISKSDLLAGILFDIYSQNHYNIEYARYFIKNINNSNFFNLIHSHVNDSFVKNYCTEAVKEHR